MISKVQKRFGKGGVLLYQNNKETAFSSLEIAIAFSIFLIFLSFFFPSIFLFCGSYEKIREISKISQEEQNLERLLEHLLAHKISYLSPDLPSCFVLDTEGKTLIDANIQSLKSWKIEEGDTLMIQCIFQDDKNQYLEKTFVLRFFRSHLYLEQYRNGYFITGDRIDMLSNVRGYFSIKDSILKICYIRKNRDKTYENNFYISS